LFELPFPLPIQHFGPTFQHNSAVLPRVSFAKVKHSSDRRFQDILCFNLFQFRNTCTDIISYYVKVNSASNLLFHFSFALLRILAICSGLVIQKICKLHDDLFGRNVSQHHMTYIPLCVRSLLQALHTSRGYLYSFYAHFTHHLTVRN